MKKCEFGPAYKTGASCILRTLSDQIHTFYKAVFLQEVWVRNSYCLSVPIATQWVKLILSVNGAAPSLERLVAGRSQQKSGLVPTSFCVKFVVDKVALYFTSPCQYHSTNAPYSFIHLPPTLYNVFLPVLQFLLSVSFHQCSILIHSSTTDAV
jgi:hypothetical protein